MRPLLPLICLLLCCLTLVGLPQAHASHIQGGQITYRYISGDTYEVTVSFYRDCNPTAATLPTDVLITAVSACNGGTPISAMLQPVPGTLSIGTGYCPGFQVLATCNPGSAVYPNYEKQDYRGTIILPPAADWIISHQSCCRPSTGNIPTQDDFRFEATLNNLITVNGVPTRANNSSPTFSTRDFAVPFVPVNQRTSVNFTAATEVDGDSLVYSLDQPLATCGVYNPYSPRLNGACTTTVLPSPPNTVCVLNCPVLGPNFTAQIPLPVSSDTIGNCGSVAGTAYTRTVVPQFTFNARIGEFTFTPNLFRPGATSLGLNKYAVVGKITEYRRFPGSNRRYRVGSVRRDFMIVVIENSNGTSANSVPNPPASGVITPNSNTTVSSGVDSTFITVYTCSYSQVRIRFTDPDPADRLTVLYTGAGDINNDVLLAGDIGTYSLNGNGTPTPTAVFYFQPAASMAGRILRIPYSIVDDACPIRGSQSRVLVVSIRKGNFLGVQAGGITVSQATVCAGNAVALSGLVNRPDSIRSVATGATVRQQYGYAWTASGTAASSGLTTAQASNPLINVTPTVTTRYYLRTTPLLGFGTSGGGCGDTTSVLVRVVAQPATPTISRVGPTLVSSAATGNQWFLNGTAISGATGSSITPTGSGTYTVVASVGAGSVVCSSAASAPLVVTAVRQPLAGSSLHIAPNPTPDGRFDVVLTGYRSATTLTMFDVLGRLVYTTTIASPNVQGTTQSMDLNSLPAGVYALRVSTVGGVDVCRVVRE
ncbi:T9SS type A sorting domain-containing protein [Hymenobacter terrenus]|uniref:T9SS type A sorting domain-containing protein n=1 Tax=Hymenobacter terrenus TaxID=1629124 RepID=UPI0006192807|nr:T9SS type A sorting domain-containing protein [Hymenobacter terrenus]